MKRLPYKVFCGLETRWSQINSALLPDKVLSLMGGIDASDKSLAVLPVCASLAT